ncbi:MAG: hypothetical protein IKN17_07875 [Ruminococcus sp.]|nr:hypothetical protein [Ruminococcus sp.]
MELKETVDLMMSENRKERLKAEYWQTKLRLERLNAYISKLNAGGEADVDDSVDVLQAQSTAMHDYLYFLEIRMKMYGFIAAD